MQSQIEQSENGLTLQLPQDIVNASNLEQGDIVEVSVVDDKIILAPLHIPKYSLEELLAGVTDENIHSEISTGKPVGKEIW